MDNAHAHPSRRHKRHHDVETPSPGNKQQRLLRSRNARFPAKKLSITGLSARFSQLKTKEENKDRSQENKHKDYDTSSTTSSLGILNELTNTFGRKTLQKKQSIPVFQDTPERALLATTPSTSSPTYHSTPASPVTRFDHIPDSFQMGLREISGNARKSLTPESPSYVGSLRGRRKAKSSFNSEEYIEHIEKELEQVRDAAFSPNSNKSWHQKLKAAQAENDRLRKEIAELRTGFETEVQRTVEHMASTEIDLRKKIRLLEDGIEQKELAIRDLESRCDNRRLDQIDTLKATIEKLEAEKFNLEQDNQSMMKRNETLTELLALSPTKSQQFNFGTPLRTRNARPRSLMISRFPSSPGSHVVSQDNSLAASPASSASALSPQRMFASLSMNNDKSDNDNVPDHNGATERVSDIASSRRSTINSQLSRGHSRFGETGLSTDLTSDAVQPQPKRRARRFLPGSTQLKPLLLPTLTSDSRTTSPLTSPNHGPVRDFSEESMDPTTQFLSQSSITSEDDDKFIFPTQEPESSLPDGFPEPIFQSFEDAYQQYGAQQSGEDSLQSSPVPSTCITGNSLTSDEDRLATALRLDLARISIHDNVDAWMSSPGLAEDQPDDTILAVATRSSTPDRSSPILNQPHSGDGLYSDDSPATRIPFSFADIPQPLFSRLARSSIGGVRHAEDEMMVSRANCTLHIEALPPHGSRKRRKISSLSDASLENVASLLPPAPPSSSPLKEIPDIPPDTPSPETNNPVKPPSRPPSFSLQSTRTPLEVLQQGNIAARPLVAVTVKTIYGMLTRYTSYVRDFKKDPLALARRLIANAWLTNWKILGKLSWWVLGLFLGPSAAKEQSHGWDWDDYDGEAIADRHCRRRSREITIVDITRSEDTSPSERHVRFNEQHDSYRTQGSRSPARPALKGAKPGWGQSILLWGKFSIALMMAVGGAVVKGPGEMLRDTRQRDETVPSQRQQSSHLYRRPDSDGKSATGASRTNHDAKHGSKVHIQTSCVCGDESHVPATSNTSTAVSPRVYGLPDVPEPFSIPSDYGLNEQPDFDFGGSSPFDSQPAQTGDETLKPYKTDRPRVEDFAFSPIPKGQQEYDPESAGTGIFSPPSLDGGSEGPRRRIIFGGDFG